MSSGIGYDYSYVDVEAERLRAARAELIAVAERSKGFNAQAKAVQRAYRTRRVTLAEVSVPASGDADRLGALAVAASAELRRAEEELSRLIADSWTSSADQREPGATAAGGRQAGARTGQRDRDAAADRTSADRTPADRTPAVRAQAVAAAEAMLQRDSPACDPADLDRFAQQLDLMRRGRTVDEVRRVATDLAASVTRSVNRRSQAERTAVTRQLLLDRLNTAADDAGDARGASPVDAEIGVLRAKVVAAPDPSWLEREVDEVAARARARAGRLPVARAVLDALQDMEYEVGEEFEDLLADTGEVVVPFRPAGHEERQGTPGERARVPVDGYGLRVTLAADRARLTAAVVRQESARTPEEVGRNDLQVQQWFCDGQAGVIEERLQTSGVDLRRTSVVTPGAMPAATVDASRWPSRGRRAPSRRQHVAARQTRNEERQRER